VRVPERALYHCGAFHRFLHFLELVELHRAVDFLLDVGHITLSLAQQGAHRPRQTRQFFRADHDQGHGAYQRDFRNAEINQCRSAR